ncbi:MAG: VOC family protein [Sphingomonadales bacterium]|jgi:catechol 2,3-dioxygenase-like lactoylglutathione lyase family enzyme
MTDPLIKIQDVAFPIFAVPDLNKMKLFLEDFGMSLARFEGETLFMRGFGELPVAHKSILGEPAFLGLAVRVGSRDDLQKLANHFDAQVDTNHGPGGGEVVVFQDPDGRRIEALFGFANAEALPVPVRAADNLALARGRLGLVKRVLPGAASVKRFGHAALKSPDMIRTVDWYKQIFGMLESDSFFVGEEENVAGIFLRCDLGANHTDHHTILIQAAPKAGLGHCGWEVFDIDDIMLGHDHLRARGFEPYWGVGRHVLGSQVFDYWRDPWGNVVEHWTDGDLLDATTPAGNHPIERILGQWGPMPPADF